MVYVCIYLYSSLSIYLPFMYLSYNFYPSSTTCVSTHYLSIICLSTDLLIYLSIYVAICPPLIHHPSIYRSSICLSIYLSMIYGSQSMPSGCASRGHPSLESFLAPLGVGGVPTSWAETREAGVPRAACHTDPLSPESKRAWVWGEHVKVWREASALSSGCRECPRPTVRLQHPQLMRERMPARLPPQGGGETPSLG